MSSLALEDGEWVGSVVRRWKPNLAVVPQPKVYDLRELIACPTCHAKVTESCVTKTGHRTTNHGSRLAPKLCPCGDWPRPNCVYCEPCRADNDRRAKRAYNDRTRRETA